MRCVFISGRTDELALERRAIFEAVARSQHFPVSFDAALTQLTDDQVGAPPVSKKIREKRGSKKIREKRGSKKIREKRGSGRRQLREQLDILIDGSDYLVGIYETSSGVPEYSLGWLSWIEYELLRFVISFELRRFSRKSSVEIEIETSERLRNLGGRSAAIERLSTNPDLREILAQRCLLFWKREPDGLRPGYDLATFLGHLGPRLVEVRTTRNLNTDGEMVYVPVDSQIFEHTLRWCTSHRPNYEE